MEPLPRSVDATRAAGHASGLARMEARRLGQHYLGPEHTCWSGCSWRATTWPLEARGLTLGQLHAAVLEELDQGRH